MRPARVLVAGTGALGSMYGGFLRAAGHTVTLLGRRSHIQAIRDGGLRVDGVLGSAHPDGFQLALSTAEVGGPFDLIVLAVKSFDVDAATFDLTGALAPDGAVLALQNGLGHLEILGERFGPARVLAAPVLIGATLPSPGSVRVTVYAKPVQISAPLAEAATRAPHWARVLADAGIPTEATTRPMAFLWEKMLYNLALNAFGAVLRLPYGALGERAEGREVMNEIIEEGFAVARADRVDLLWPDADGCRRHFHTTLLPPTSAHRSSMLQDIERGRRTEIDAINGYVCRRGRALGIPTPRNQVLCGLVHAIESARRG